MRECVRIYFVTTNMRFQISTMSSKDRSSPTKEKDSFMLPAMQQQFERMNVMFGEVQDRKERQETAIASLREESFRRGSNVKRPERCATPHLDEIVDENEDEEAKDLEHASFSQSDRFQQPKNRGDGGFQQHENFSHKRVGRDFGICDGLDRNEAKLTNLQERQS